MGVLQFTGGGSNRVKFQTVTATLADIGDGAWTECVVFKRSGSSFQGLLYGLSGVGDGTTEAGFGLNSTNALIMDVAGYGSAGQTAAVSTVYMAVVRKAAGLAAVTYELYNKGTGTWATPVVGSNLGDQIDITQVEFGAWQNGDFFSGHIGIGAIWEGAMTQANAQALATNWQTSDLYNSAHGQPKFLCELNVAGTSATDLIGNASNVTVTGTSLDAAETLTSWNFDGTGATVSIAPALAMAPYRGAY